MNSTDVNARLNAILGELSLDPPPHGWAERAALCEEVLEILPRMVAPEHWAAVQSELGTAYLNRPDGDRAANLEHALEAFEEALGVQTRETTPAAWAHTMTNLGATLRKRQWGDPAENLERAIAAYEQALEVRTRAAMPREWAATQLNLAVALQERRGDARESHQRRAVEMLREVLDVFTPESSPVEWATAQVNLGYVLFELAEQGAAESFEEAIAAFENGLRLLPRDADLLDWAYARMNLGTLYFERHGAARGDDLERALAAGHEALAAFAAAGSPLEQARALCLLAGVYTERQTGSRAENLEQAVDAARAALEALDRDAEPEDWAAAQTHLGHALRWRVLGDQAENQEGALAAYRAVLEVRDRDRQPLERARAQMSLANLYQDRLTGDRGENVERALDLYGRALAVVDRARHPLDWARLQLNLGNAWQEHPRGDRDANLVRSIEHFEAALEVEQRELYPHHWAGVMNNLGNSHRLRGDPESLERARECYGAALEVRTRDAVPRDWALTTANLGIVYRDRLRGDRPENLERAIKLFESALKVLAADEAPRDWAGTMMNLGMAWEQRLLGASEENVERAIATIWRAIEIYDRCGERYHRAIAYNFLGIAFLHRPRGNDGENQDIAISCFEEALEYLSFEDHPVDWGNALINLAGACGDRRRGDPEGNAAVGLEACAGALRVFSREKQPFEWASAHYCRAILRALLNDDDRAISDFHEALDVLDPERYPGPCQLTAQRLGDLHFDAGRYDAAVEAYPVAMAAAENLYLASMERRGKEAEIARIRDLYRRAAYALARCGDPRAAVLVLERARARGLGAALGRDPAGIEDLARAARPDVPVAYLTTVSAGSLALTVWLDPDRPSEPRVEALWVDALSGSDLEEMVMCWRDDQLVGGYVHALFQDRAALPAALEEMLPVLGERLVDPLVKELLVRGARGVVLIPTGLLTLLPVHAAALRSGRPATLLDAFDVVYAPSALVLGAARERAQALRESGGEEARLAGVGNPLPHPLPLVYGQAELHEVEALWRDHREAVDVRTLYGEAARRDALVRGLDGATHVHLSCHGVFDAREARKSRLELAGGDQLSLADLLGLKALAGVRLVVLSACETAIAEFQNHPDEALGLPAGFLQAGACGVIGTLWSVRELSTALLIRAFYQFYLRGDPHRGDGPLEAPAALRRAQLWLRQVEAGELLSFFEGQGALLGRRLTRDPEHWSDELLDRAITLFLLEGPRDRPYAHPYFWAGFVYVGAGLGDSAP